MVPGVFVPIHRASFVIDARSDGVLARFFRSAQDSCRYQAISHAIRKRYGTARHIATLGFS